MKKIKLTTIEAIRLEVLLEAEIKRNNEFLKNCLEQELDLKEFCQEENRTWESILKQLKG